jgi:SagB-type dehydrogenase family enzyme
MRFLFLILVLLLSGCLSVICMPTCGQTADNRAKTPGNMKEIALPEPATESSFSIEKTLHQRRSVRSFTNQAIQIADVSQLMWAAQGITESSRDFRTSPSAGATFPMEIYVVATNVGELEQGLYHYQIGKHTLEQKISGDLRGPLLESALMQEWLGQAAAIIIVCADYSRTTGRYGERGIRYVHIEAGHVGQNLALQAVALGLGTTMVGAFYDEQLQEVLNLPTNLDPLYIIPVGHPR